MFIKAICNDNRQNEKIVRDVPDLPIKTRQPLICIWGMRLAASNFGGVHNRKAVPSEVFLSSLFFFTVLVLHLTDDDLTFCLKDYNMITEIVSLVLVLKICQKFHGFCMEFRIKMKSKMFIEKDVLKFGHRCTVYHTFTCLGASPDHKVID